MNKLQKIRNLKFKAQNGHCYYCCQPMWFENPSDFAQAYGLKAEEAQYLRATAEHLLARSEGGADSPKNIVAACWFCNTRRHQTRHPLPPSAYLHEVRASLREGRWHGLQLNAAAIPVTPAKAGA